MKMYIISVDLGYYDETYATLFEIDVDKLICVSEKSTFFVGENKITKEQMEELKEYWFHYANEKYFRTFLEQSKIVAKILKWDNYNIIKTIFDGPH
jgi:hypothetical protein